MKINKYYTVKDMKQRLSWVDIAKGVCILLMIFGHVPNLAQGQGIDVTFLNKFMAFNSIYTCFFMQSFFILTGFTSNFGKERKLFYKGVLRTLAIPCFALSFLTHIIDCIYFEPTLMYIVDGQRFLFIIEDYWFLHALIFSKVLFYEIKRIVDNDFIQLIIFGLFLLLGAFLVVRDTSIHGSYHYNDYLHYKDFLCMAIFLVVGYYIKKYDVLTRLGGVKITIIILFLVGHAIRFVCRYFGIDETFIAPVIFSHGTNLHSMTQVPAYLFYVITGSISFFCLCEYVGKSRLFEFFGRESLVFYGCHFVILEIIISLINKCLIPDSYIHALFFLILVYLSCLFITAFLTKPFKEVPLKYLIGK